MFNIFQQPWTLLITAVIVQLIVFVVRAVYPQKNSLKQFAPALILIVAAFSLDFFIKTDLEKITSLLETGIKAVEQQNYTQISDSISPNYSDSVHKSKSDLVKVCEYLLPTFSIKKMTKTGMILEISPPTATATVTIITLFDENSRYVQELGKPVMMIKMRLSMLKNKEKQWLINRAEITELNKQKIDWSQVH